VAALLFAMPLLEGCPTPLPPPSPTPATLPPQAPPEAPTCGTSEMLQGGRWLWEKGEWRWDPPRCAPRPPGFRDGCVWQRGRWSRPEPGAPFVFQEGRMVCP
jgi:hypothetical protein